MEWLIISYVNNLWASFFFFLLFTQINSFTPMFYRYISRELEGNYEPLRIIFIRLFFAGVIKASARDRAQSWDWGATSELRASRSVVHFFFIVRSSFSILLSSELILYFFSFFLFCVSSFATFPLYNVSWIVKTIQERELPIISSSGDNCSSSIL